MSNPALDLVTERLLRDLAPQVLGALARRAGDFAAAEDAVQEALIAASTRWPRHGHPDNPRAWLMTVASRRLKDHQRSEIARRRREAGAAPGDVAVAPSSGEDPERDDTLALFFTCCHPSLTTASAIALTLRALGGLTTVEIARAFLVPETTMAQRISRAKQTIRSSGVRFEPPEEHERSARKDAVLHILYLIFSEGYATTSGTGVHRVELSSEAIRLTRLLVAELPDDPEVAGLLALMILTDARRVARTGPEGQLVPLELQDRSRWNREGIAEGVALINAALRRGAVGPYQIQAAIAALHDEAPSTEATDWAQILALYDLLLRVADNPMARLSRAVALAMVQGSDAGLEAVTELAADDRVADHYRLHAVRGHLLERKGEFDAAITDYLAAAERTASLAERNYLLTRAAGLKRQ